MSLHDNTFNYLRPTDPQMIAMNNLRGAATIYNKAIENNVPEGPDRTYLQRKLREVAMWANIAVTREPNGAPRT